jgi:hypothetical protein
VICKSASEAEVMLAATVNSGHNFRQFFFPYVTLNGVHTFRCWAPFQIILVVNIGSSKEHFVSVWLSVLFGIIADQHLPVLDLFVHK